MKKMWIDDMREAPDESWTVVRKVEPAIRLLSMFEFDEISIDHDIENRPDDETFKPIAYFLALKYQGTPTEPPKFIPKITIHSDNPVGAKEIQMILLKGAGIEAPWKPYTKESEFKTKYGLT
jgi:hypothetical protein